MDCKTLLWTVKSNDTCRLTVNFTNFLILLLTTFPEINTITHCIYLQPLQIAKNIAANDVKLPLSSTVHFFHMNSLQIS